MSQIFMTVEKQYMGWHNDKYMGWHNDKERELSIGIAIFKHLLEIFKFEIFVTVLHEMMCELATVKYHLALSMCV